MFIEKWISLALMWYIILPHNHHLTLHKAANVKLVYVPWCHRIHRTDNGKMGHCCLHFCVRWVECALQILPQMTQWIKIIWCQIWALRRVHKQHEPQTLDFCQSQLLLSVCTDTQVWNFAFFSLIRTIEHLSWWETYQIKANEILFSMNIFHFLYVAYRAHCRQRGVT